MLRSRKKCCPRNFLGRTMLPKVHVDSLRSSNACHRFRRLHGLGLPIASISSPSCMELNYEQPKSVKSVKSVANKLGGTCDPKAVSDLPMNSPRLSLCG